MTVPSFLFPKAPVPDLSDVVLAARAGDTALARTLIDQILQEKPAHEQALLWKAVLCRSSESPESYLEQVLALNPGNPSAFATLQLYREGGREHAEAVPKSIPNCPVCYRSTGGAHRCVSCGSIVALQYKLRQTDTAN